MANINLLTIHWTTSYGGIFQTYATCKLLESLGHSVTIINLVPKYIQKNQMALKNILSLNVVNILQFLVFRKKYCSRMTKRMSSIEEELIPHSDYTIVGSDQVWNPAITRENAKAYFLDFVKTSKRISLASSFGLENPNFDNNIGSGFVLNELNSFHAISIREESGEDYLKKIGVETVISRLVDPTIALGSFDNLVNNKKKRKEIFKFNFYESGKQKEIIANISERLGVPVHKSGFFERKFKSGPLDWISNFYRYDCIITNSFHGLVFSLLFKKNFYVLQSANSAQFTRLFSLLDLLGLQNRFVSSINDIDAVINTQIDYDNVYSILTRERDKFYSFVSANII